jgi:hypothetical protein
MVCSCVLDFVILLSARRFRAEPLSSEGYPRRLYCIFASAAQRPPCSLTFDYRLGLLARASLRCINNAQ